MFSLRQPTAGRARATAVVALAWSLVGSPARAAEGPAGPYAFDWKGGPACPPRATLVAAIDELVGEAPPDHAITARARVEPGVPPGVRVRLETESDGVRGERVLEAPTCAAAAEAVVIIVALMVRRGLVVPAEPPSMATRTSPPPPPPPLPPPPPPPPPIARRARPAEGSSGRRPAPLIDRVEAEVGVLVDVGLLPAVAPGFAGGARLVHGPFRLAGFAGYFPAQRAPLEASPAKGGEVSLTVAGIDACGRLLRARRGALSGSICAGGELDHGAGSGFGVRHPEAATADWMSLSAGALGVWDLVGPFSLEAHAAAVVPLTRPRFVIDGLGPVHQASPVAGRGGVAVAVHF